MNEADIWKQCHLIRARNTTPPPLLLQMIYPLYMHPDIQNIYTLECRDPSHFYNKTKSVHRPENSQPPVITRIFDEYFGLSLVFVDQTISLYSAVLIWMVLFGLNFSWMWELWKLENFSCENWKKFKCFKVFLFSFKF